VLEDVLLLDPLVQLTINPTPATRTRALARNRLISFPL